VVGSSFFFYSILRWSVAVSTMRRQSSRIAAFLQADARPMFCWPRSASTARSQVWPGLPGGRFQSGGSPRITAATARWWSSCGELWSGPLSREGCRKPPRRLGGGKWRRLGHSLANYIHCAFSVGIHHRKCFSIEVHPGLLRGCDRSASSLSAYGIEAV